MLFPLVEGAQEMLRGFVVAMFLAGLLAPAWAEGQVQDVRVRAAVTIPTVLNVSSSSSVIHFPSPNADDFDRGYVEGEQDVVLSHYGNVPHEVQVVASAPWFSSEEGEAGGEGGGAKPLADLEVRAGGDAGPWQPLSVEPVALVGVAAGRYTEGVSLTYRMRLDYETDSPGTYSATLTYLVVPR